MAKKDRKPNISTQALERARAELAGTVAPATPSPAPTTSKRDGGQQQVVRSFKRTMTREELSHEYGYVLADLQSMGILALILFVGMIAVAVAII